MSSAMQWEEITCNRSAVPWRKIFPKRLKLQAKTQMHGWVVSKSYESLPTGCGALQFHPTNWIFIYQENGFSLHLLPSNITADLFAMDIKRFVSIFICLFCIYKSISKPLRLTTAFSISNNCRSHQMPLNENLWRLFLVIYIKFIS